MKIHTKAMKLYHSMQLLLLSQATKRLVLTIIPSFYLFYSYLLYMVRKDLLLQHSTCGRV